MRERSFDRNTIGRAGFDELKLNRTAESTSNNPEKWAKVVFWTLTAIGITLIVIMLLSIALVLGGYFKKAIGRRVAMNLQKIDNINDSKFTGRKTNAS